MLTRTHYCGSLRASHVGQTVVVCGWVNTYRDQGRGLVFCDLRDREGLVQVVFDLEDVPTDVVTAARGLRREDVIAVRGTIRKRAGDANPRLATGEIEVLGAALEVLSKTEPPPILPDEHDAEKIAEETRLRYRYIDLRRPRMQHIMRTRSRVTKYARDYFAANGFLEIETPLLIKSTPEGARDFIVPSRLYPGAWYALPQSPQLFKQILMVAGFDRYLQICKCLRDEDPRADRQAEFTQIDLEMSFVQREQVIETMTGFARGLWKEILDYDIPSIPTMTSRLMPPQPPARGARGGPRCRSRRRTGASRPAAGSPRRCCRWGHRCGDARPPPGSSRPGRAPGGADRPATGSTGRWLRAHAARRGGFDAAGYPA